jgi:hypothetical protein
MKTVKGEKEFWKLNSFLLLSALYSILIKQRNVTRVMTAVKHTKLHVNVYTVEECRLLGCDAVRLL